MARLQYSEENMLSALHSVNDGMSISKASKLHLVPRTTLAINIKR